jgi:hypothetical protein
MCSGKLGGRRRTTTLVFGSSFLARFAFFFRRSRRFFFFSKALCFSLSCADRGVVELVALMAGLVTVSVVVDDDDISAMLQMRRGESERKSKQPVAVSNKRTTFTRKMSEF